MKQLINRTQFKINRYTAVGKPNRHHHNSEIVHKIKQTERCYAVDINIHTVLSFVPAAAASVERKTWINFYGFTRDMTVFTFYNYCVLLTTCECK